MSSREDFHSNNRPAAGPTADRGPKLRAVLDPLDRVPEVIFGVLMAVSFTGSISVADAGRADIHTMIFAAFGCNIAWGLTDAVMYLLGVITERQRKVHLLRQLQATRDLREAHRLITDALPERLAAGVSPAVIEGLHRQLLGLTPPKTVLGLRDLRAALAIFLLVVVSTFPVVVPFLFLHDTALALRSSNLLALLTLFIGGYVLGKYAGASPWRYGTALTVAGAALMAAIIALGG